jgi:hypothetical protein
MNRAAATALGDSSYAAGIVAIFPFVDEAGLRKEPEISFFVRNEHTTLWATLDRTSCFLEGPPGSGKSTAVWFWLLRHVLHSGRSAVWLHFDKVESHDLVYIQRVNGQLVLERIFDENPFDSDWHVGGNIQVCVVDGVTKDNKHKAGKSWKVFGLDSRLYKNFHMIWVSSQQVLVAGEHLQRHNIERHIYFSWSETDIIGYAATFSPTEK